MKMGAERQPLVSIGMPVYNGGKHLKRAIDSILAQDYPNLELIISDNASTDDTAETCQAYAARDPRIRYQRTPHNMGAAWNFHRVHELAKGDYFMWAAADDWREANYLSQCVAILEREQSAILCYSKVQAVYQDRIVSLPLGQVRLDSQLRQRFSTLLRGPMDARTCTMTYGLIRTSALRHWDLETYYGSDYGLLLRLCLQGRFVYCSQTVFYYTVETRDKDHWAYYQRVFEMLHPANRARKLSLPLWKLGGHLLRIALTAPLSLWDRTRLAGDVVRYYFFRRDRWLELRYVIAKLTGLRLLRNHIYAFLNIRNRI